MAQPTAELRSRSSSSRMRSVFSRIALMFRNIHFGGELSGIPLDYVLDVKPTELDA